MNFQIKSIVLWSKNNSFEPKEISFELNKINIITGASRTGKSAIIPIIDYCLGSGVCRIPVETIRKACGWFGVIIQTDKSQILLARPEPGMQKSTDEMYVLESSNNISIPKEISKNTNRRTVVEYLNRISSISPLQLEDKAFYDKISFRDLIAFTFQPQNIVTNPNILFYKADSAEHRNKLINIFPYVLGAVTPDILAKRQEYALIQKQLERKTKELDAKKNTADRWITEINGWLFSAKELGLIDDIPNNLTFNKQIQILENVSAKRAADSVILTNRIEDSAKEINELLNEDRQYSAKLELLKKRYMEMSQLMNSLDDYKESLHIQIERLHISKWLKEFIEGNDSTLPATQINNFYKALQTLEEEAGHTERIPVAFDREYNEVKKEIDEYIEKLNAVRKRINIQANIANSLKNEKYTVENISKFIGKIQQATEVFKEIGDNSQLNKDIAILKEKLKSLAQEIDENRIKNGISRALKQVNQYAMDLIVHLDSEWKDAPISVDIKNLSVSILRPDGRYDALWEVGSGSNWLSYHVAVTLAFQLFFCNDLTHSPVPNFIIYDQPSQVYFPSKSVYSKDNDPKLQNDEDREAVEKIFKTMSLALKKSNTNMQMIVLEHANEGVWGTIEHIYKVAEWRGGEKLIPSDWIEGNNE